jgi:hypothetical protein
VGDVVFRRLAADGNTQFIVMLIPPIFLAVFGSLSVSAYTASVNHWKWSRTVLSKTAERQVHDVRQLSWKPPRDAFRVGEKHFSYSTQTPTLGFRESFTTPGACNALRNGAHARVSYHRDHILRIEIADV